MFASPKDRIWGIGLTEDDPRAWNKKSWRGGNLLGEILTRVRDKLMGMDAKTAQVVVAKTAQVAVAKTAQVAVAKTAQVTVAKTAQTSAKTEYSNCIVS